MYLLVYNRGPHLVNILYCLTCQYEKKKNYSKHKLQVPGIINAALENIF